MAGVKQYPKEWDDFILENWEKMTHRELTDEFNKKFNQNMTVNAFSKRLLYYGKRKGTQHRYTVEEDEWLIENYMDLPQAKLAEAFNSRFGTSLTKNAIQIHANAALNLIKGNQHHYSDEELDFMAECVGKKIKWQEVQEEFMRRFAFKPSINSLKMQGRKRRIMHDIVPGVRFSDEQEEWLTRNVPGAPSWEDVACRFRDEFGVVKGQYALRSKIRSMNAERPQNERVYINGGRTGTHAGVIPYNEREVGSTRKNKHSDYTYIKTGKDEWIPMQKAVWENEYGKLPDDWFVVFLDGNRSNFELDNLYPVDRAIHAGMCRSGWYKDNKEQTLAAIKACELDYLLKNPEKKEKMKEIYALIGRKEK